MTVFSFILIDRIEHLQIASREEYTLSHSRGTLHSFVVVNSVISENSSHLWNNNGSLRMQSLNCFEAVPVQRDSECRIAGKEARAQLCRANPFASLA